MSVKIYDKLVVVLCSHGLSRSEAKMVLEEYAEMKPSMVPNIMKRIKERRGPIKVIKNSGSIAYIEGNKEFGQIVANKAVDLSASKAKRYGIGLVGAKSILSFMHPGTYAEKLARKGLFGLVMIDGGRAMVTHPDSSTPVIGTNPLAFGMPTAQGPWVVDMATSKYAWAKVRKALAENTLLPPETYKTRKGKFTRNPKQAFSAVPFGDYKGFVLGMMVEILCGGLFGMTMGKNKKPANYLLAPKGAVFIAIDIKRFVPVNTFKRSVTRFLKEIKDSKRNPKVKRIRIPGESSFK